MKVLFLTQRKFAKELLKEFGDAIAAPIPNPLNSSLKLSINEGD